MMVAVIATDFFGFTNTAIEMASKNTAQIKPSGMERTKADWGTFSEGKKKS